MKKTLEELIRMPRMGADTEFSNGNSVGGLIDMVNHIGGLNDKVMVEIGCFRGVSTETFLQFNPKKLYAVDIWGLNELYTDCDWIGSVKFDLIEQSFRTMAKNYDNIEIIKNFSKHASFGFKNKSLDFVYIDGDHSYDAAVEDIEHWLPKIKSGGYIAGHDIAIYNVLYAVQKTLDTSNMITFSDTSWLVKV
jgi:predicted O-methyltransferase YrrM